MIYGLPAALPCWPATPLPVPASMIRGPPPSCWGALGEAGASDAATALTARAANAGMFDLFLKVRPDEARSYLSGGEPDGAPSQSWKWQEPTDTVSANKAAR